MSSEVCHGVASTSEPMCQVKRTVSCGLSAILGWSLLLLTSVIAAAISFDLMYDVLPDDTMAAELTSSAYSALGTGAIFGTLYALAGLVAAVRSRGSQLTPDYSVSMAATIVIGFSLVLSVLYSGFEGGASFWSAFALCAVVESVAALSNARRVKLNVNSQR